MRWAVYKLIVQLFIAPKCYKSSLGYNCHHEMHGDVKECGYARSNTL